MGLLVGFVLLAAACSSSGGEARTTSAPEPNAMGTLAGTEPDSGAAPRPVDPADVARFLGECMRQNGWEVMIDDAGVEFPPIPDAQVVLREGDLLGCEDALAEAGVTPQEGEPVAVEHVRLDYDIQLETNACLVENGYPVPAIPSWERYLDSVLNGSEEDQWSPLSVLFEAAAVGDSSLIEAAIVDCLGEGDE